MRYDQLLPVYQQATGLPGSDAAFNQWVQGIINATGAGSVEAIPENFFTTPQGQQYVGSTQQAAPTTGTPATPTTGASSTAVQEALQELRLDPDFAALPANWQQDIAQMAVTSGLEAAIAEMGRRAAAEGQDPQFADARAALARWSQKGNTAIQQQNTGGTTLPLEQDILNQILPGLLGDIEADEGRRTLANTLAGQATDDYNDARNALSPEENDARLQEEYAQADITAGGLSDSAATAAADQLAALQASIEAMQGNLTGALAEQAAALQEQVATLTANLDTLDATQKAAIVEQIQSTQRNLEQSINSQWGALQNEVDALEGAADAQSVARRNALQAEIDGLTAAQAPLAKARLDSANALATAVNLGLQSTTDAMDAQRAKQGYLGSSTFDRANLARATIGANQQAAQLLGNARELNAGDMRTIQARGATEGRVIADELANNLLGLAGRRATGTRSLADLLATGTQGIWDSGAAARAAVQNNTAGTRFNIGSNAAAQQYQNRVTGADQGRSLADALATGTGDIATTQAQQQQQARDSGITAKQGYFDNAFQRGLAGLLSRPGLAAQLASTLGGIENYGNTGLNRTLGALNWWGTNTQAPTAGYVPVNADNTGNDIAGLGAGLLSTGLNLANSKDFWTPKDTASTYKGIPLVNTPETASGKNWWM